MCHHYDTRDWARTTDEDDEEDVEVDEEPAFLENEPAEDVELLTDGGDDDE